MDFKLRCDCAAPGGILLVHGLASLLSGHHHRLQAHLSMQWYQILAGLPKIGHARTTFRLHSVGHIPLRRLAKPT